MISKKIVSLLLAIIMIFTSVPYEAFAKEIDTNQNTSAVREIKNTEQQIKSTRASTIQLFKENTPTYPLLSWKGLTSSDFVPSVVSYSDTNSRGKSYAYCLNPDMPGIDSFPNDYNVDISKHLDDPRVWGALLNGFPNKTLGELGLIKVYEGYLATKMAIWCIVHPNYANIDDWKPNYAGEVEVGQADRTYEAFKKIVLAGRATTSIPTSELISTAETPMAMPVGNNLEQVFSVTSQIPIGEYKVEIKDINAPSGTKITDINGNTKDTFNFDTKFKIVIPKIEEDRQGTFELTITSTANHPSFTLYEGIPSVSGRQHYAVQKSIASTGTGQVSFVERDEDEPNEPNTPEYKLQIIKVEAGLQVTLSGAIFRVKDSKDSVVGEYKTDGNGQITLPLADGGLHSVEEIEAPHGYQLSKDSHRHIEVKADEDNILTFENKPKVNLEVMKVDADTGELLAGAVVRLALDGGHQSIDKTTGVDGIARFNDLDDGTYTVTEIVAPKGYILDSTAFPIKIKAGEEASITLKNKHKPSLVIKKYDEQTGMPLGGAEFSVKKLNGSIIWEGIVDETGKIVLEGLEEDWYIIEEIAAPDGYIIAMQAKTVHLQSDKVIEVKFDNRKKPSLDIIKLDEKTGEPLKGAIFHVKKTESLTISEYVTDESGMIRIKNLDEGIYTVSEITAPTGYLLDDLCHKDIELTWGTHKQSIFKNQRKPNLIITKLNALTGKGVPDTTFKIEYEHDNGGIESLGTFKTNKDGKIILKGVGIGWYIVTEIEPAQGMSMPSNPVRRIYLSAGENIFDDDLETPTTPEVPVMPTEPSGEIEEKPINQGNIKVTSGFDYVNADGEIIENYPLNSIVIKKIDAITSEMLEGAVFEIRKVDGGISGTSGTIIGRYTTNPSGIIVITGLEAGAYLIEEVKAPTSYIINENSIQNTWLKADGTSVVELTFSNYPYGSVVVSKVDAETNKPLQGAKFKVTDGTGAVLGTENGTYTSDVNGEFIIKGIKPNTTIIVTEEIAPDGYILDNTPQTLHIGTEGKTYKLTFTNRAKGGLQIKKIDTDSRKPLQGVEFEIAKMNGEKVSTRRSSVEDDFSEGKELRIGSYKTDKNGLIHLTTLENGWYTVVETKTLKGYLLDDEPRNVEIKNDQVTFLEFENKKLSGLYLKKVDSVTGEGIFNVEFRVYDFHTKQEKGVFYTDNQGIIDFYGVLEEGRYTIVETREADGYIRDQVPRTIEFKAGVTTEILWKNTPLMGQLQVAKVSASDNETNGLPKGTALSDAVFEVYHYKTGNLVDQFTTGQNGIGVSKPLPIGRYTLKEVKAPNYYKLSDQVVDFEIEFSTQIVKIEFANEPANTGVAIQKVGVYETMPNTQIKYDFKVVQNQSSVPLSDFYFRDLLPTNAVRLDKVQTGTYNQSLRYKIMYKTNLNDYRVLTDNLSTTVNHTIDTRAANIGLFSNEYVTEIMFVFGTVKAGFSAVEKPSIYATTLSTLTNGFEFANKCDIGGKYNGEWIIGNSTWLTKIYNPNEPKLPKTGY